MRYYIILPVITCLVTACADNNAEPHQKDGLKDPPVKYELATIEREGVATTIKLPAQFAAYEEVSIFPKVNGYVKNVMVDIGSKVSQGHLLMTLEAPELEQASSQAKENYETIKSDFSIDKEHYQRLLEASKTPGAVSPLDLSSVRSKMDADSSLCNAGRANWQMQQTMLAYLTVTAPFTGVITERNVNPGALVSAAEKDKPMLELKQVSRLRLQVDVPEDLASTLKNHDPVDFYVNSLPGKKMIGRISRRSNNMNSQYRSERMEIDVDNKENLLAPGMYAEVELHSQGNPNLLCVPRSAVVISTEAKYVIVVRNGKTQKVDVETRNQNNQKIEVVGALKEGEKVIARANDEIKEGVAINE